jgi:7-cyano-7-deazaguanine synthase
MPKRKKAIILFSGGLDSTTVLYYALNKGYNCSCLLFDYKQRHKKEIKSALKIAKDVKVKCSIVKMFLPWSNDVLTNKDKQVPIHKFLPKSIPPTYLSGRNTLFLSYALSYSQSIKAEAIFIGVNAVDFSNYQTALQIL